MDLKGFTDLGNDIGRRVSDAINDRNFDQLDRDIRNKIDQAFYGPGAAQNQGCGGLNGKLYHETEDAPGAQNEPYSGNVKSKGFDRVDFRLYRENSGEPVSVKDPMGIPVQQKLPGRISGVVMMGVGYGVAGGFGIAFIILSILSVTVSAVGSVPAGILGAAAAGVLPLFLAGLVTAVIGTKRYGLVRRFKRYLSIMRGEKFCTLKEMAEKTGKSVKFVAKDIRKMIDKGFFLEGHMDDQNTCFIGTDALYQQYVQARDSAAQSARAAEKEQRENPAGVNGQSEQLEQVIAEGKEYIRVIREANDAIYNPEISQKLYRMEHIVKRIFDYVRQNPDQVGQLRRFMSYYMPTTEKLVNAYRDLDEQTIQGENITKAKGEIARTLDTINEAYEKLYDSMYADVAMDVSSDISVLKTIFAQEGLAGDEMNGGKK